MDINDVKKKLDSHRNLTQEDWREMAETLLRGKGPKAFPELRKMLNPEVDPGISTRRKELDLAIDELRKAAINGGNAAAQNKLRELSKKLETDADLINRPPNGFGGGVWKEAIESALDSMSDG